MDTPIRLASGSRFCAGALVSCAKTAQEGSATKSFTCTASETGSVDCGSLDVVWREKLCFHEIHITRVANLPSFPRRRQKVPAMDIPNDEGRR